MEEAAESKDVSAESQITDQPKEEAPVVSAEERLWGVVKSNPADFNAWTELIQETEKSDDILKLRICYDAFLLEFPLCYGYWIKYADFEARFSTSQEIVEVCERAVKAVTHSVDIWIHYCTYAADKFEVEEVIRLFERAVAAVGTDYLSHNLWERYLDFASVQQDYNLFMHLNTRILEIPLQQLDRFFTKFKQCLISKPWLDIKSSERRHSRSFEALPKDGDEVEKYLAVREASYKKTRDWDAKIRDYENAIRRPYFHVKSLDDGQLANWHRYLDFMEKEADLAKAVKVFERCLIACANYPEYWMRYAEYLEKQNNLEMANEALARATNTFVKRQAEIHIFAARFKERTGEIAAARKAYKHIFSELSPGNVEAIVKAAHLERRQGDINGACSVFESAIEMEKAKDVVPSIYVQYVHFLERVGLVVKAKQVLDAALQRLPNSKLLVETAIDFEYHTPGEKQLDKLSSVVERATKEEGNSLSNNDREELSHLHMEFIDAFGDVKTIMEAESRHEGLFPFRKAYIDYRKRLAHDSSFSDRAKKSASPAAAAAAAQSYGAQWGAYQGYPQNWQQQQQQQPQQQQNPQANWSAYSQQAGYGYGSYSAYAAQPGQQQQAATTYSGYGSSQVY